jgi:AraC-like DNA-binding protein
MLTEAWCLRDVIENDASDVALQGGASMHHLPLVIYRETARPQVWWRRLKHLDFHSLYITESGRGLHVIDSTTYAVARGDVYVMGVGSEHHFADYDKLVQHTIHFSHDIFPEPTWQELENVPGFDTLVIGHPASRRHHLHPSAYGEVARDLAELWSEWRYGARSDAPRVRALLLRLLLRLARFAANEQSPAVDAASPRRRHTNTVADAIRIIDLNYGQGLRVADLAAAVHLSRHRFRELFLSVMGRTPRDYIWHVRLEHAKTLLATTVIPIAEIAETTGFSHPKNFSARFRASTALTPREFRRQAQS